MIDFTECTECGKLLVYGDDDTGDNPDRPICEECQMEKDEISRQERRQ